MLFLRREDPARFDSGRLACRLLGVDGERDGPERYQAKQVSHADDDTSPE